MPPKKKTEYNIGTLIDKPVTLLDIKGNKDSERYILRSVMPGWVGVEVSTGQVIYMNDAVIGGITAAPEVTDAVS